VQRGRAVGLGLVDARAGFDELQRRRVVAALGGVHERRQRLERHGIGQREGHRERERGAAQTVKGSGHVSSKRALLSPIVSTGLS
jgi:hypothetical protein